MKKRLFLSAAKLCLSLALIFNSINGGSLDCVYTASEENYDSESVDFIFLMDVAKGVRNSGQWLYFDKGDHISVCGYLGNEEHITVPSEIEGKPVTELSYGGVDPDRLHSRNFFGDSGYMYSGEEGSVISPTVHITISDTVTRIGANTFYGCNLEQADMPEGLTYIGDSAFAYCGCLKKADIPKTVTFIGDSAFYSAKLTAVSLPEGLEFIGPYAFAGSDITQITVPDSVKYIGRRAFAFCWSLEEVKLPESLTKIPEGLFVYCLKLKAAKIPEGVQIIEPYAFDGCSELEALHIPSTVTVMSEILGGNSALKDIYFNLDSEAVTLITGSDPMSYFAAYGNETDLSNVVLHYTEKVEAPQKDPLWDYPVRSVFLILGIAFFLTFAAALCLYIMQKIRLAPAPVPKTANANIPQGNALTGLGFSDGILCEKCGAESGKIADYCYNCGKKLKKR
ncbi:MAG: leucine-rich repeat domain-containing protein [Ruminiclostridium sp.]|nr:leucine-rich repeat domain-containing protein [Ruminiclostridium sp.]